MAHAIVDGTGDGHNAEVTSNNELKTLVNNTPTSPLPVTVYDTGQNSAEVDDTTGALETITYPHHEIHSGNSYAIATFEDIGAGDPLDLAMTTPDTATWAHIIAEVDSENEAELYIYEGATITGGTSIIPTNRNRNSLNASAMTAVSSPTVNTTGTLLLKSKAGSGKKQTGQMRSTAEIILRQDTIYVFRVINSSTNTGFIAPTISWYEHVNL